jgi:hypothetical protein
LYISLSLLGGNRSGIIFSPSLENFHDLIESDDSQSQKTLARLFRLLAKLSLRLSIPPREQSPSEWVHPGFARGESVTLVDILSLVRKAHHHKISHSLDPHSGARTVVRLRAPSVRFPPSGQTKSPSVFTLGSFVCCPLGGSVRNNFLAVARKFSRPWLGYFACWRN